MSELQVPTPHPMFCSMYIHYAASDLVPSHTLSGFVHYTIKEGSSVESPFPHIHDLETC